MHMHALATLPRSAKSLITSLHFLGQRVSEGYIIRGSGRGERDTVRAGERGASLRSLTLHGTP